MSYLEELLPEFRKGATKKEKTLFTPMIWIKKDILQVVGIG